jgi:hypothetical protein
MPVLKYYNPDTSAWETISAAGPAGPIGAIGPTGPAGPAAPAGTYWGLWSGTQAAYDALGTYDANTLYAIVG